MVAVPIRGRDQVGVARQQHGRVPTRGKNMIAATITVRVHVLCNSGEPTANATITKLRSYSEQNFDGKFELYEPI